MQVHCVFGVLLVLVLTIPAGAQTPVPLSEAKLGTILDTRAWQTIDLPTITLKLPVEFQRFAVRCFDYDCGDLLDAFKSKEHHVLISSGRLYTPTTNHKDLKETIVRHNGILGHVFQFSSKGKFHFSATFPSEQIGGALASLQFWSSDPASKDIAYTVLQSVQIKKKLHGSQRILLLKECETSATPMAFDYEELIKKIQGKNDSGTASEIRARRVSFEVTPDRHQEIVKTGAGKVVLEAIAKAAKDLEEQTKVYETFAGNLNAREPELAKKALEAATEFLNRWSCDPMWQEHVRFMKPWVRRLEVRIAYPW